MVQLIEDKLTPLTQGEAALKLNEAWKRFYGKDASIDSLSLLWAQSALETGRWKKLHCYNWGNVKKRHAHPKYKSITDDGHDYCMYRCNEILNGKVEWFDPPHPQTHFRAYHSAADGASDYLRLVANKKRYKKAWSQVLKGDPVAYCKELKKAGYFTANLYHYTKGVVSLSNEFKRKHADIMNASYDDSNLDDFLGADEKEEIINIVGLGIDKSVDEYFSRTDKFDDEDEEVYFRVDKKPWWRVW